MDDLVERLLAFTVIGQSKDGHQIGYESPAIQRQAAARIQALEASLAEAEGRVIAEVVAWLRKENGLCDCFARSEGECACGAWDDYKTKPLLDIATALETGEWKK